MDPKEASTPPIAPPTTPTAPPAPAEPAGSKAIAFLKILGSWLLVPAIMVLILHFFIFQAFKVVGQSMVPTLNDADYLIISKIDLTGGRIKSLFGSGGYLPERGEIVVFRFPRDPSLVFVKRVVGLPGDRVIVKDGQIRVYNRANPQGINPDSDHQTSGSVTGGNVNEVVTTGNVFVVGDNRTPNGSYDSRDWGLLSTKNIIGEAVLRLLPVNSPKFFTHSRNSAKS